MDCTSRPISSASDYLSGRSLTQRFPDLGPCSGVRLGEPQHATNDPGTHIHQLGLLLIAQHDNHQLIIRQQEVYSAEPRVMAAVEVDAMAIPGTDNPAVSVAPPERLV